MLKYLHRSLLQHHISETQIFLQPSFFFYGPIFRTIGSYGEYSSIDLSAFSCQAYILAFYIWSALIITVWYSALFVNYFNQAVFNMWSQVNGLLQKFDLLTVSCYFDVSIPWSWCWSFWCSRRGQTHFFMIFHIQVEQERGNNATLPYSPLYLEPICFPIWCLSIGYLICVPWLC